MAYVAPSTVLAILNTIPPGTLSVHQGPEIAAVVRLAREIPLELLPSDPKDYAQFMSGIEAMAFAVAYWQAGGNTDAPQRIGGIRVVEVLREALTKCREQSPSTETNALSFIKDDAKWREAIRIDISTAESALRNGEWKAATVIAGSAIEALLLWKIKKAPPTQVAAAISSIKAPYQPPRSKNPDDWYLGDMLLVSLELAVIKDETCKQGLLARDFRNLIHAGKAQRLAANCDYGTALAAVAALQFVIRDLS